MRYLLLLLMPLAGMSQSIDSQIEQLNAKLDALKKQEQAVKSGIVDLKTIGLPSNNYIEHSALILEYAEPHEQAKWVAHMIIPDIAKGKAHRSNDFREDPLVKTGTTTQIDYFLTDTLADGTVNYDGFGYDRGHLAPSADFSWSPDALSESYYYSNMSPQRPKFNQEKWADLEGFLRKYVIANKTPLYVLTAPVLTVDLPKVERATNHVTIPEQYVKIAYDKDNNRAIAFVMENQALLYPLESYAVSVAEAEKILGYSSFKNITASTKENVTIEDWFTNLVNGDVEPIYPPSLNPKQFNTIMAKKHIGNTATVCGEVVSSRYSRKGHLWLNLDRQFPNNIFSVFIRKDDLANFDYDPEQILKNEKCCFKGKISNLNDVPTMNIGKPESIKPFEKRK